MPAETQEAREKRTRIEFLGLNRPPKCEFDAYRTEEDRLAMVEYLIQTRRLGPYKVVEDLRKLNAIGLAYLYRDVVAATESGTMRLADYDASAWSGR